MNQWNLFGRQNLKFPRQVLSSRIAIAEVKSVPLSVIVYSEILFMDDERPSSCARAILAPKRKVFGK